MRQGLLLGEFWALRLGMETMGSSCDLLPKGEWLLGFLSAGLETGQGEQRVLRLTMSSYPPSPVSGSSNEPIPNQ